MSVNKVFLSYTLKDSSLSVEILKLFKSKIETNSNLSLYIDIIDNKNILDYQAEVYNNLYESDAFWKLDSSQYNNSIWATKEFDIALEKMRIFVIKMEDINFIIEKASSLQIKKFVKQNSY